MKNALKAFLILFLCFSCAHTYARPRKKKPVQKKPAKVLKVSSNTIQAFGKAWDAIHSYQAKFVQTVRNTQMGTPPETSSGSIFVIKPNKIRWETVSEGEIQILNGIRLTLIKTNERRGNRSVEIYPAGGKLLGSQSLSFLSGHKKFAEVYNVQVLKESAKEATLKLHPKDNPSETFVAEVDKNQYLLRALAVDSVGTSTRLEFSDIHANADLPEALFMYEPLPADVVHENK